MFQGHLDCNSENLGESAVEQGEREGGRERRLGLIHEKVTDHLHRKGMHEKSSIACLGDL